MSVFATEFHGLTVLQAETLSLPGVCHGFSTRPGGVSPAPYDSLNLWLSSSDDPAHVAENYRRFCAALSLSPEDTVCSNQVHGDAVRAVTQADAGKGLLRPRDYEADALITNVPGLALTVFSADCCLLLFYEPKTRCIGACHAGWRGVALGIAAKTVEAMVQAFGADPAAIRAAIGPTIDRCCFQTDRDVPAAMEAALGADATPFLLPNGDKWQVDLKGLNALWLTRAGLLPECISTSDACTVCRPDLFWSHRMTGSRRGSQVAMIALTQEVTP